MAERSFRFTPPPLSLPPAAGWVLAAAFGPESTDLPRCPDPATAARWASALAVGERIAARRGREALRGLLGSAAAEQLERQRKRAAADELRIRELARVVSAIAATAGVELLLLKGAALLDLGVLPPGGRRIFDLDVLARPAAGAPLAAALDAAGFHELPEPGSRHLPPRSHPELGLVEIHTRLEGVEAGGETATLSAIAAAGLCRPAGSVAGALSPCRELLTAHLMAHALGQHGLSPRGYPALRLYADLLDLGAPAAADPPTPAVAATEITPREAAAARELAALLGDGSEPPPGSDAAALLAHALAGAVDPDYGRALRAAAFGRALRRGEWHKLLRATPGAGSATAGGAGPFGVGWAWIRTHLRRKRLMAPVAFGPSTEPDDASRDE